MAQLRRDNAKFVSAGVVVLVVGPESPAAFAAYWHKHDLPFIGLPDPDHSVLKRFGQDIKIFKWGRMPAQVLIDKTGVARFVHYGHDMSDIPTTEEMLAQIASLEGGARFPSSAPA